MEGSYTENKIEKKRRTGEDPALFFSQTDPIFDSSQKKKMAHPLILQGL